MKHFELMEGVVVDTNDPQQMGRVKIWVPALDGDFYNIADLPWATFISPTAGQTLDYPAGPNGDVTSGYMSYGWWSIPKKGALVVVSFLYGDVNRRIYLGCYFNTHGNRSLPEGRNRPDIANAPVSDTFEPVQPQTNNLNAQFGGKLTASEAITRGAYERAVAQGATTKDGTEGYEPDLITGGSLDPQTHTFTSPGRHSLIFQDNPTNGRARLKTAAGHQIILDDANERVYISTATGNNWIELDQDGRIHIYGADSISMSTGGDFSVTAAGNMFFNAGGDVNIQGGGKLNLSGCGETNLIGAGVNIESAASLNILAAGTMLLTGKPVHFNGPKAGGANCPDAPTVVPTHEPWTRPSSKHARGKNWKP